MNQNLKSRVTSRTRVKKEHAAVPQSLAEANTYIAKLGDAQREIDAAMLAAEAAIAKIKEELDQKLTPHLMARKERFDGLFAFASAHKAELTIESKTVVLTAGRFLWRFTPPAVAVASDAEMIKKFKKRGKLQYIRVVEELDREAMLKDRAKLLGMGVHFSQKEEFVVVPDGIDTKSELKKSRTISLS